MDKGWKITEGNNYTEHTISTPNGRTYPVYSADGGKFLRIMKLSSRSVSVYSAFGFYVFFAHGFASFLTGSV